MRCDWSCASPRIHVGVSNDRRVDDGLPAADWMARIPVAVGANGNVVVVDVGPGVPAGRPASSSCGACIYLAVFELLALEHRRV